MNTLLFTKEVLQNGHCYWEKTRHTQLLNDFQLKEKNKVYLFTKNFYSLKLFKKFNH